METRTLTADEALDLLARGESHFWDFKSSMSSGKVIQKIGCALANADGGEFLVGVEDVKTGSALDRWKGFASVEDGNHIMQSLSSDVSPSVPYLAEWLQVNGHESAGFACLLSIRKSPVVHEISDGTVYVRRNASNAKIDAAERVNLALSKGAETYENQELGDYTADELAQEDELANFLGTLSPKTAPADFVRKQRLANVETGKARLSGAILFAESPSAVATKRCAVKVARYETKVEKPDRKHLSGVPVTIEAPAYRLIEQTIAEVQRLIEAVSVLKPTGEFEQLSYPPEALKEVIVNAVIHRDYNISDDIVIRVFDNRVEVKSPGRLPGHMTLDNLLTDRFSRNPTINRLINKYPDPPNKDIGEGLKTTMRSMAHAKLKPPRFAQEDNYFVVTIEHTPLARPQEIVLQYLASHDEVTNAIARELTGINSENTMKEVFYDLRDTGVIERVPGKGGNRSAWRLVQSTTSADTPEATDAGSGRRRQRVQPRRLSRSKRRGKK
ncbi:ATP-binding protein [Occultella aeris]|uniref:Divergent AAA domain protein n=1 Tax=Occultella aeris TaxID=2761496 RepID=A0A7M4DPM2_9MICO|nr:ATP-binding protein [Occultella aeris]VZO39416.1 Divergent AAA domain protein [Occultella aeris]